MFKLVCLVVFVSRSVLSAEYTISPIPIGAAETAEPNVMILMDTSGSMDDPPAGQRRGKKKIDQAKSAARAVIESGSGMQLGLASFNYEEGGKIDQVCGSKKADLLTTLDGYGADNWTPMSEAYYEVTRYFRGMKGHFSHTGSRYSSPITSQCQKNFTIVITDGEPTKDGNFSQLNDADAGSNLPNWDTSDDDRKFTRDRWGRTSLASTEKWYYLDDLAKFAWDTDMSDQAGMQNMYTYTIGFDINFPMLNDAAVKGHGDYFTAGNEAELLTSLQKVFADISRKVFSDTQLSANSGYITSGLNIYQASYNTGGWSGELSAFSTAINAQTGLLEVSDVPVWSASSGIPSANSRMVITNRGSTGIGFRWNSFTSEEKTLLFNNDSSQVDYIRGESVSDFRARQSQLGDIIHSNPIYVGPPQNFNSSSSYRAFKKTYADREPMIYVGANDGMLHGFRASDGEELLAYIPSVLLPKLSLLSNTDYQHQYYVDGTPTVQDVYINNQWHTMLAGGLNGGGQGVYVLDVTDPDDFSETEAAKVFRWEFDDSDDVDMGYSYARPAIARLKDGNWYVVFGNGYNSTEADDHQSLTGDAVIYLVDLATGQTVIKLSTNTGLDEAPAGLNRPNGMSTLSPVSDDGATVNVIYGGDLYGNIWKFDLSDSNPANWKLDYKLFQACRSSNKGSTLSTPCAAGDIQPITSRLAVSEDVYGHNMVFFGTGKDFEIADKSDMGVQSFYGVIDSGSAITGSRSQLLEQSIYYQGSHDFNGVTRNLRLTTNNRLTGSQAGWFIDLKTPDGNGGWLQLGERVLNPPGIRDRRVLLSTRTYTSDPCKAGGNGWTMELDKSSGSRFSYVTVDNNRDGQYDDDDKVTDANGDKVNASGQQQGNGNGPLILTDGIEDQIISTGDDSDPDKPGDPDKRQRDPNATGRSSWRYLEERD
ncbi:PilC/PilY family type IV pilus protein [Amphritea atlantica]|nr:PilC/PilY family type IV pilus protein [Amphritea atlantica]